MRLSAVFILLLVSAMFVRPSPAHAVVPGLAVETANTAAQVGISGALAGGSIPAVRKKAEKDLEADLMAAGSAATKAVRGQHTVNMQSKNCRIHTGSKMKHTMDVHSRILTTTLDGTSIDTFFDNNSSPRLATIALQRLCKNGQLSPDDFGLHWFVANGCFYDPSSTHAFLKASTILDHPVLLKPSPEQMKCLDSPSSDTSGCPLMVLLPSGIGYSAALAWRQLNDKQRLYVSALRYCENLENGRMPNLSGLTGDAAATPEGMAATMAKFSSYSKTALTLKTCRDEINRRTAPDFDAYAANASISADEKIIMDEMVKNKARTFRLIEHEGYDMTLYGARKCTSGMPPAPVNVPGIGSYEITDCGTTGGYENDTTSPTGYRLYISPYVLQRYARDWCLARETAASIYADTGGDAGRTLNTLKCATIIAMWESLEARSGKYFAEAIIALQQTEGNSVPAPTAPIRANYEGPGPSAAPQRKAARGEEEAALFKPVALTMGGKIAADVSAPPGAARGERQ